MNFTEYQEAARKTAVFTHKFYPVASIGIEFAELMEIFGREEREKVISEAGDVLWNAAAVCDLSELDLGLVVNKAILAPPMALAECLIEAMKLQDAFCKPLLRGDDKPVDGHRVFNSLVSIIGGVTTALGHSRASLALAAERNLEKLSDRQARGVLKGDGGER